MTLRRLYTALALSSVVALAACHGGGETVPRDANPVNHGALGATGNTMLSAGYVPPPGYSLETGDLDVVFDDRTTTVFPARITLTKTASGYASVVGSKTYVFGASARLVVFPHAWARLVAKTASQGTARHPSSVSCTSTQVSGIATWFYDNGADGYGGDQYSLGVNMPSYVTTQDQFQADITQTDAAGNTIYYSSVTASAYHAGGVIWLTTVSPANAATTRSTLSNYGTSYGGPPYSGQGTITASCSATPSGTTWQQLNGSALDTATGPNGDMWVIGTDDAAYEWNGSAFVSQGGSGSRIAVGPEGYPWIVDSSGRIFFKSPATGNVFQQIPGPCAVDIGASGLAVWLAGCDHQLYQWNQTLTGNTFSAQGGNAVRISVDTNGTPWYVDTSGNIFFRQAGATQQVQGCAGDVGAYNGAVWVTGCGTDYIYYWTGAYTGATFTQVVGSARNISVGSNGLPLVSNSVGGIYQRI